MPNDRPAVPFPTTCWSRVVRAGDPASEESRSALEGLCRDYWSPLVVFVRRKGYDSESAEDVVQGLFGELLRRDDLRSLHPGSGRFRSFLMACCCHYLAKQGRRERALKRGGGASLGSLEMGPEDGRLADEPRHDDTPERLFEREWALTLLGRVQSALDAEMAASKKPTLYAALRPSLLGQDDAPAYHAIAESLDLTEGAVKMAASRLRARYRALLRDEIGRTVADPSEIEDEIHALVRALGR